MFHLDSFYRSRKIAWHFGRMRLHVWLQVKFTLCLFRDDTILFVMKDTIKIRSV